MDIRYYVENKSLLFTAVRKVLDDCGLYWIDKYCKTRNMCLVIKELKDYYYGTDDKEEAVRKIMKNIEGLIFYGQRTGLSYDHTASKLKDIYLLMSYIHTDTKISQM